MRKAKKSKPDTIPLLHVYGQGAWHDDVYIVGNKKGLQLLLEAIKKALADGQGQNPDTVFAADGEGYDVAVVLKNSDWPSEDWDKLARPYSGKSAKDSRKGIIRPNTLVCS